MRHVFLGVVGAALAGLLAVAGCGKVSQDVGVDDAKKPKIFTLKAYVQMVSTADYRVQTNQNPSLLNQFTFTPQTREVYVAVMKKTGPSFSVLSWGRATLSQITPTAITAALAPTTSVKPQYKSNSYDKNDFELQASDVGKTRLSLDSSKLRWESESKSLPSDLEAIWLAFYDAQGNYALRVIEKTTVSGNETVSIGEVNPYETFVASMLMMQQAATENRFDKPVTRLQIINLFSPLFFEALSYAYPANQVDKFNVKDPQFKFNRKIESELLAVLALYLTDKKEALKYVEARKSMLPVPEAAWTQLRATLLREINTPSSSNGQVGP